MQIEEVTYEEYKSIISNINIIYLSADFQELNKYKANEVLYLLFKNNRYRFAMCIGLIDNRAYMPFSAPFSNIITLDIHASMELYDEALANLREYLTNKKIASLEIILPPVFYDNDGISKFVNSLYRNGFNICSIDVNYDINLNKLTTEKYKASLYYNAKKNLNISLKAGLTFKKAINNNDISIAYDIIAINRSSKGYPLRMNLDQILETIKIIKNDIFIVYKENEPIASAFVFYINKNVVQVIYWGDKPGNSNFKPINFLAYQLVEFYLNLGLKYIDIGPSSKEGIPNYGLCDFKQSIGCETSNKFSFKITLSNSIRKLS